MNDISFPNALYQPHPPGQPPHSTETVANGDGASSAQDGSGVGADETGDTGGAVVGADVTGDAVGALAGADVPGDAVGPLVDADVTGDAVGALEGDQCRVLPAVPHPVPQPRVPAHAVVATAALDRHSEPNASQNLLQLNEPESLSAYQPHPPGQPPHSAELVVNGDGASSAQDGS
eukprot:gene4382-biopygen5334